MSSLATIARPAAAGACLIGAGNATTSNNRQAIDVETIRAQFPIFAEHPDLTFLDNAATTHKPRSVIDTMDSFYRKSCANAGRAAYSWSTQLTAQIEDSRKAVARLINAQSPSHIAFTAGATDSLNQVATSWGLRNLEDGDEVMLCLEDHRSATLPWFNLQMIARRFGVNIKIVTFNMHDSGTYDRKSLCQGLSSRTRLIAMSHVHHLYGMEMDLPELRQLIPDHVLISLDASQSIGHTVVDVEKLGVHFLSFSGHKMFAANGSGALWVHPDLIDQLWPTRVGAKSAVAVLPNQGMSVDPASLAGIVECGTLNLPGILSFAPAVSFIESVGMTNIEQHISASTHYLHKQLKMVPGIEFGPGLGRCNCTKGYGIMAFNFPGIASGDLAAYLDSEGIFVRTGDHCRASDNEKDDYIRVSLQVYNSVEEIDRLVEVLNDAAC